MPSPRHSSFRLLADLPLVVAIDGIIYRLAMVEIPASGLWRLEAQWPGGYWVCAYRSGEEALGKVVYQEGLDLGGATVAYSIFERLVKEKRAEAV
jgi:hypothetical protein